MWLRYCYKEAFYTRGKREQTIFDSSYGKEYIHIKEALKALMKEIDSIPYQRVTVKSFDGLTLSAKYYHTRVGAPLEIQFHGYRSSGLLDFCGGTKLALKKGHNVLVVDQRGHGLSEGDHLTFGAFERYDCISWINYARKNLGETVKIFLLGTSMGAATVLLASAFDISQNVVGIIADSPYSRAEDIIKKVCADRRMPENITYPLIEKAAKKYMNCDLKKADICRSVKKAKVPILIIHGDADAFVPCAMSEEILKSAPDRIKRVIFPKAGHVMAYMTDPIRYENEVNAFMEECVKKAGVL